MRRSAESDARSAIGARRSRAAGAVTVAALPSHFSRGAPWCGTHFRHRGVALAAATSGAGRHVFDVASRRYTKIGTSRKPGAPRRRSADGPATLSRPPMPRATSSQCEPVDTRIRPNVEKRGEGLTGRGVGLTIGSDTRPAPIVLRGTTSRFSSRAVHRIRSGRAHRARAR